MDKKELIRLIDDGHSSRKIAEITGMARGTICYWIEKYGLETKFKGIKTGRKHYDWIAIQKFYDENNNIRKTAKKFMISTLTIARASKKGKFKSKSRSFAARADQALNPRKHTEETKKKMSSSRKKYLMENPDKVPYLLNHSSKGDSYPEKYFSEVFKRENIPMDKKFRLGTYQLDFADVEKKIDIEIDGSQHRNDPKIVSHDIKRNNFLAKNGWKVFRVYWPEFQKKTREDKEKVIEEIKSLLLIRA